MHSGQDDRTTMNTAICTLFERDYHHGVAALTNSLVRQGFTGRIFAGYRGPLPAWAEPSRNAVLGQWTRARILPVTADCEIVFLPLATEAHFTNIKPDFLLDLLSEPSVAIEHVLYLDPDICLVRDWQFMRDWMSCGVALCEDVNSPIGEHHPRRVGWRVHFGEHGIGLRYRCDAYVNGGCVGVARRDVAFLENWKLLGQHMAEVIGGHGVAKVDGGHAFSQLGFASCFSCSDQDVLNAALQMTDGVAYSILPRSAMAFCHGEIVIPHALGPRKPWRRRYVLEALGAVPPTAADKAYWQVVDGPLQSMAPTKVHATRLSLGIASALARFYCRN
jgi:hypothetical protein